MRNSRIILALLALSLLVSACTTIRLGYENLPRLAQWQVDRYLSLDNEQEAIVARHAASMQSWHRQNLLPVYADFLSRVEQELGEPVTVGQVAEWRRAVVDGWLPLAERLAPAVAEVAVTLRPEQLAHLQKAIEKANRKSAQEYLPSDPREREEARYQRLVERAESFFGDISDAQKQLIRESSAALARNEDAWWESRLARQRAIVTLLTDLSTARPAAPEATRQAKAVLAGLFSQREISAGRAGVDLTATLLSLASPQQRRHMVKRLDGYRQDFAQLSAR